MDVSISPDSPESGLSDDVRAAIGPEANDGDIRELLISGTGDIWNSVQRMYGSLDMLGGHLPRRKRSDHVIVVLGI